MLKFTITQDDIDHGVKKSTGACAGALAVYRAMPETKAVSVGKESVFIDGIPYPTPAELQEFIARYDQSLTVEPMEFTLA